MWWIVVESRLLETVTWVHNQWNKPQKKRRRRSTSKGCARFYARVPQRRRAFHHGNSKSNRIVAKLVSSATRSSMDKSPRYLPQLSIGSKEEIFLPRICKPREASPQGIHNSTSEWDKMMRRATGQADCWEYCLQALKGKDNDVRYDSDSFRIAIDNCASSCFTNNMKDFVGTPKAMSTNVVGIGTAVSSHIGTVRWLIVDDNGS
jgi:hypothetical protein